MTLSLDKSNLKPTHLLFLRLRGNKLYMQMCYHELERLCGGFAKKASEAGAPGTSALVRHLWAKLAATFHLQWPLGWNVSLDLHLLMTAWIMRGRHDGKRAVFRGRQQHLCCLHWQQMPKQYILIVMIWPSVPRHVFSTPTFSPHSALSFWTAILLTMWKCMNTKS